MDGVKGGAFLSSLGVSATGLRAESLRMEVIANNVANASTTRGPNGKPFRRQEVVFESVLDNQMAAGSAGVRITGIQDDSSELQRVFNPDHPHADADGYVEMPNVVVSNEMVDLVVASRAYEANLSAMKTLKDMANSTLELLR